MPELEVIARRWISQSKWDEHCNGHYQPWMTKTGGRIYNPQRDGWTEYVVVPDDDPRAETLELYGPQPEPDDE